MSELVLAQLMAQGLAGGADVALLRGLVEEAGELGATRALTRLGLADAGAPADVKELRELLAAWRDAKRSALKGLAKAAWAWVLRIAATLLLAGLAVKLGFGDWVK